MNIEEQLAGDEGYSDRPYRDSKGIWTVGFGWNLEKGPPMSREIAVLIMREHLAAITLEVCARLPWATRMNKPRFAVVVQMAYNMGIAGLISNNPKGLAAMKAGKFVLASKEMLDGTWKDDVGGRAYRLAKQMRVGEWQQ